MSKRPEGKGTVSPKIAMIVAVSLVVTVALVFCVAPMMRLPYTTLERYQATEVYYEREPYVVREEYTEIQEHSTTQPKQAVLFDRLFVPYPGHRTFQTYINISGKSNITVKGQFTRNSGFPEVEFYVSDDTDPGLNIGIPKQPIVAVGPVGSYTFSFVPQRSGTYYFRFVCYQGQPQGDLRFFVGMEWQETTVVTQEVTKYRDVTKYKDVRKERVVWKERPVIQYKRVSLLRYLLSQ